MDIKVSTPISDAEGWHREWHDKRNAAVAALVKHGAPRCNSRSADMSREAWDDEEVKWLFWRQHKTEAERGRSDSMASPDAYLYEGATTCMKAARDDERKRIATALSAGLKVLLGDEFTAVMYDIAEVNGINIGRD